MIWRSVFALAIAETAAWGILYYAFGVFVRPIAEDLHTSEAIVAGAFSVMLLAGGVVAGTVGRSVDRFGPRRVMTAAAVCASVAFFLLGRVTTVPQLFVATALLGMTHAGVSYEPAFAAITTWFRDDAPRLRALLVLTSLAGLASTIFVPATTALHRALGWRGAVEVLAGVCFAITVPLLSSIEDRAGSRPGSRTDDCDVSTPCEPVAQAMPSIGLFSLVFAIHSFGSAGIGVHLVSHLHDGRLTLREAGSLVALLGVAQVAGRLLSGPLRARIDSRRRLPTLFAAQAVALVLVASGPVVARAAGILLFGAANGLVTLERATLVAERFGTFRYAEVSGRVASVGLVARSAAPFAVGLARDRMGSGPAFFGVASVVGLAGIAAALFLRPSRPNGVCGVCLPRSRLYPLPRNG